ncbi:hypothetical protein [Paraburkholderia sp. J12]|uniref:hypothetical protein n=1 Tax=Paraburkholderia sp. J12 TaxID=2805432 RepID=UPI002ABD1D11|nr:hypothetical protein [Paraburkholderia sp. J12]
MKALKSRLKIALGVIFKIGGEKMCSLKCLSGHRVPLCFRRMEPRSQDCPLRGSLPDQLASKRDEGDNEINDGVGGSSAQANWDARFIDLAQVRRPGKVASHVGRGMVFQD